MKRYAIFGGTFDPFTIAHRAIVKGALDLKDFNGKPFIDKLFVAPTIVDYHRVGKKPWLNDDQKLEVINAILNDLEYGIDWELWLDDFRLKKLCKTDAAKREFVDKHRFINTLLSFKAAMCHNPDDEVYVIIGSDSFFNFKQWYMHNKILEQAKLIVVPGRYKDDEDRIAKMDIPFSRIIRIDESLNDMSGSAMRCKYEAMSFSKLDAFKFYMKEVAEPAGSGNELLLHTPIFDVVKGGKTSTGLQPIKIDAPDWVTIIVEKDGKFLVEEQFRYGSNCNVSEFPCGMVEPMEQPLDAAIRELQEETGYVIYDPASMKKIGETNPNPAFMMNKMHYFYVNLDKAPNEAKFAIGKQKLDEHEKIEFCWIDKCNFMTTVLNNAMFCKSTVPAILLSAIALYQKINPTTKKIASLLTSRL
jgi:nicotinic acid mononucleotide adenylyltransferase/ADP-ribose pyrophosphatase YjhB (NUDIX family)